MFVTALSASLQDLTGVFNPSFSMQTFQILGANSWCLSVLIKLHALFFQLNSLKGNKLQEIL